MCFAGLPAGEVGDSPARLVKASVAAQAWARFTWNGPEAQIHFVLAHLFHAWLPHCGLQRLPNLVLFEQREPTAWQIDLPLGEGA
jgi:predicted transcriptional regulator YdeE